MHRKALPIALLLSLFLLPGRGQDGAPANRSDGEPARSQDGEPDIDSARIVELNRSALKYLFLNTDSGILYAQEELIAAHRANQKKWEGQAYYLLGGNYWIMGNYTKALSSILEAVQLYERLEDRADMADAYRAMATIYRDQGDFRNAISYAEKGEALTGRANRVDIHTVLGSIYEKSNQLDSAMRYLKMARDEDISQHGRTHYGYISLIFGNVYHKLRDFPKALAYYREGIALIGEQKVYKDLLEAYTGIARLFWDMSVPDSTLEYSRKAIEIGRSTPFLLGLLDASSMLTQVYRTRRNFDSTVRYMDLSFAIKDSLYNQQKAREFQTLVFKEQLRQEEIEEARTKAEEERKENVQMLGIAAFIPVFFIVLLILSRRKVKSGLIDFMVLVGLLLFFEFISLLIHPHLETWTHNTPILMLLALVIIAAMIVPSHHRLEKWLKKALVRSNMNQPDEADKTDKANKTNEAEEERSDLS